MSGFYHKHFLKLLDFTPAELNSLLQLAAMLKASLLYTSPSPRD